MPAVNVENSNERQAGMIVSHRYQFIFIKTSKTAGTSLEIALSCYCGDDDIITPVRAEDEAIRKSLGYRGPQHHEQPLVDNPDGKVGALVNHSGAGHARRFLGEDIWQRYFKFCVVRDPWDRFLSYYHWRFGGSGEDSIAEVLRSGRADRLNALGYRLYTQDDRVVVDHVCRYENLTGELDFLEKRLGLPNKLELPRAKGGFRPESARAESLGLEEKLRIQQLFEPEIRLLGYPFPV